MTASSDQGTERNDEPEIPWETGAYGRLVVSAEARRPTESNGQHLFGEVKGLASLAMHDVEAICCDEFAGRPGGGCVWPWVSITVDGARGRHLELLQVLSGGEPAEPDALLAIRRCEWSWPVSGQSIRSDPESRDSRHWPYPDALHHETGDRSDLRTSPRCETKFLLAKTASGIISGVDDLVRILCAPGEAEESPNRDEGWTVRCNDARANYMEASYASGSAPRGLADWIIRWRQLLDDGMALDGLVPRGDYRLFRRRSLAERIEAMRPT